MNNDSKSFEQEIEELYEQQQTMNYYELLGISKNADQDQIKRAFRKLVAVYHPDRYSGELSGDLGDKLISIFNEIKQAYEALSDAEAKVAYDQNMQTGKEAPGGADASVQAAEVKYRAGLEAMKSNNISFAIDSFKAAIQLDSNNSEYYAKLAMVQCSHPRYRNEALENANKALKMNPENANYYALIGRIYQKMDDLYQADVFYNRALTWDPNHRLARQETAVIRKTLKEMNKSKMDRVKEYLKGVIVRKGKTPKPADKNKDEDDDETTPPPRSGVRRSKPIR